MRKYIVVPLLIFLSATVAASSRPDSWVEARSPHFDVLTNSNVKNAMRIAIQFERMRAIFHTLFPAATDDTDTPITVLALKDKKNFQALEPEVYLAKGKLNLAGLFLRSPDRSYILLRLDAEGEHPYATVYHEYTHYMLRHGGKSLPLWLNEGLAEFYQNTEIEDKEVRLGEASAANILFLRQNKLLPLDTLLRVDRSSPYYHEEDKGTVFYAESWALTHYLMLNDSQHKTGHVQQYADLVMHHQDPVVAAQQAFGDLGKLQHALNAYVQQSSFYSYKMKTPSAADSSAVHIGAVSTPDADAIRADVLLNTQRTQDAEALLGAVLREEPNNALAHETMGMMKFRAGDIAAAKKWYGEAVQLKSDSYLAHYYYAVLSLRSRDASQDATIESSLRTAIKLNPNFAPSYDALAMFYASRHEKFDEAHMLNLHAVLLEPDNIRYRMNTAEVLLQNQQFASALSVLQLALKFAKTQPESELIQIRIDQIEKYQMEVSHAQKVARENARRISALTNVSSTAALNSASNDAKSPVLIVKFKYPTGPPSGPRHVVEGIIHGVQCFYPSVITFDVLGAKKVFLYSNDFSKIDFKAANYTPQGKLHPCTGIEGMKASIQYGEVSDPSVDGQIVSVLLSK